MIRCIMATIVLLEPPSLRSLRELVWPTDVLVFITHGIVEGSPEEFAYDITSVSTSAKRRITSLRVMFAVIYMSYI